jgi:hypothetical protein
MLRAILFRHIQVVTCAVCLTRHSVQADVLESIALFADDSLSKWELAVSIVSQHLLRALQPRPQPYETSANPLGGAWPAPPPPLLQRIAEQLLKMTQSLAAQLLVEARSTAPVELRKAVEDALERDTGQLDWTPL